MLLLLTLTQLHNVKYHSFIFLDCAILGYFSCYLFTYLTFWLVSGPRAVLASD